jgi:hypothetical protein
MVVVDPAVRNEFVLEVGDGSYAVPRGLGRGVAIIRGPEPSYSVRLLGLDCSVITSFRAPAASAHIVRVSKAGVATVERKKDPGMELGPGLGERASLSCAAVIDPSPGGSSS